jgi:hypothetical protein
VDVGQKKKKRNLQLDCKTQLNNVIRINLLNYSNQLKYVYKKKNLLNQYQSLWMLTKSKNLKLDCNTQLKNAIIANLIN